MLNECKLPPIPSLTVTIKDNMLHTRIHKKKRKKKRDNIERIWKKDSGQFQAGYENGQITLDLCELAVHDYVVICWKCSFLITNLHFWTDFAFCLCKIHYLVHVPPPPLPKVKKKVYYKGEVGESSVLTSGSAKSFLYNDGTWDVK